MIVAENSHPSLQIFQELMTSTDSILNTDAAIREDYYLKRSGKFLETDVYDAICEASKGTEFEGTIQLISGASFPDIIAHKYYGVEVKSTISNHWTSIGSSILESTRNADVERIYLTFGKLGRPVKFISRPYESCLSGIVVTHYPRYQIDMRLAEGNTIFDKMGVSYDYLRKLDNPVDIVSDYYRGQLKDGESLWWARGNIDKGLPATVTIYSALPQESKENLLVEGCCLFPEILGYGGPTKYNRFALWLVTHKGIVCTNVRDLISAGGQELMQDNQGRTFIMPGAFRRILRHKNLIEEIIVNIEEQELIDSWKVTGILKNRIKQWCELVLSKWEDHLDCYNAWGVLTKIFPCIVECAYSVDRNSYLKYEQKAADGSEKNESTHDNIKN